LLSAGILLAIPTRRQTRGTKHFRWTSHRAAHRPGFGLQRFFRDPKA